MFLFKFKIVFLLSSNLFPIFFTFIEIVAKLLYFMFEYLIDKIGK